MKTQLRKPARSKASYSDQYKQEALELWRSSGRSLKRGSELTIDTTPRPISIVSNRFMFTGREYAANFGFYEYRARAYHPGLGRFTQLLLLTGRF